MNKKSREKESLEWATKLAILCLILSVIVAHVVPSRDTKKSSNNSIVKNCNVEFRKLDKEIIPADKNSYIGLSTKSGEVSNILMAVKNCSEVEDMKVIVDGKELNEGQYNVKIQNPEVQSSISDTRIGLLSAEGDITKSNVAIKIGDKKYELMDGSKVLYTKEFKNKTNCITGKNGEILALYGYGEAYDINGDDYRTIRYRNELIGLKKDFDKLKEECSTEVVYDRVINGYAYGSVGLRVGDSTDKVMASIDVSITVDDNIFNMVKLNNSYSKNNEVCKDLLGLFTVRVNNNKIKIEI